MKKNLLLLVLFAISVMAFSFAASAQAQTSEYQKALQKMLTVSGGFATAEVIVPQAIEMLKQSAPGIPESYLKELSTAMTEKFVNRMVEIYTPIYQKHLSLEDIKKIIAFYESPVGRKLGNATPFITKESMQVGQQLGIEIVTDIQKAFQSYGKNNGTERL